MSLETLEDLLVAQLQDIYYAEKHLAKALPKMEKKAQSPELKAAFKKHTAETANHVVLLEQVFELLGKKAKTKRCPAMDGLLEEGKELMEEAKGDVLDAGLILAAQKVEHYEIATYGSLKTFAQTLGMDEAAEILFTILAEETATDEALTELAVSGINQETAGAGSASKASSKSPKK